MEIVSAYSSPMLVSWMVLKSFIVYCGPHPDCRYDYAIRLQDTLQESTPAYYE